MKKSDWVHLRECVTRAHTRERLPTRYDFLTQRNAATVGDALASAVYYRRTNNKLHRQTKKMSTISLRLWDTQLLSWFQSRLEGEVNPKKGTQITLIEYNPNDRRRRRRQRETANRLQFGLSWKNNIKPLLHHSKLITSLVSTKQSLSHFRKLMFPNRTKIAYKWQKKIH